MCKPQLRPAWRIEGIASLSTSQSFSKKFKSLLLHGRDYGKRSRNTAASLDKAVEYPRQDKCNSFESRWPWFVNGGIFERDRRRNAEGVNKPSAQGCARPRATLGNWANIRPRLKRVGKHLQHCSWLSRNV